MKRTAARLVCEVLERCGVDCIFGMEDPIHIFHAVDRRMMRIVTMHDERHGAIMAHGYAAVTGRPGVCAATFGPGATNLITGLYEAQRSSIPVIALVQDHPLRLKGRHANSELDHAAALAPFVKAVIRIDYPDRAAAATARAVHLATSGRPGPVALLCPTDVIGEETEADIAFGPSFTPARSVAAPADIARAAGLLAAAASPVIVSGGGAMLSGAAEEVRALAERFEAPVATTLTGRGIIPDAHPLATGAIGNQTGGRLGRGRIANLLVREADLVLLLGTKTGQLAYADWTLFSPGTRIVHLDVDPAEPGRNFAPDAVLVGDVRETLRALLTQCEADGLRGPGRNVAGRIAALKEEWRADNRPYCTSDAVPIRAERLISEVNAVTGPDTIVVADASYASGWVMSHVDVHAPGRSLLSPRGTGMIGWGFAAAIGAKMGRGDRTVICVTGDGGFQYLVGELETAARYGIKVVTVVLNNATLGFQRHWEEKALGSYRECDFLDVDFAAVARAMGCEAERLTRPDDLAGALARALAASGPYLVDAVVSPEVSAPITGFERGLDLRAGH
jgi:acetolactate synthase I/II/III large subunit